VLVLFSVGHLVLKKVAAEAHAVHDLVDADHEHLAPLVQVRADEVFVPMNTN